MLRRIMLLLIIPIVIFGCAEKNTAVKETHALKLVGTVPLVGNPVDLSAGSNSLYVAEDNGGLSLIDMTSLTKHWYTFLFNPPPNTIALGTVRKISFVEGQNKLFINEVTATDLIRMIDVSNPDAFTAMADITGGTSAIQDMVFTPIANPTDEFTMEGFFCNGNTITHKIYDNVNNMWSTGLQGTASSTAVNGISVTSDYIFAAIDVRGLQIFNRTNGSIVSETDLPGVAKKVKIVGNYAYVVCRQAGLQIVDIANPASPVVRAGFETDGNASTIDVQNNLALVSSTSGGVYLFDVTNPAAPVLKDHITSCGYVNSAIFHNSKVIVAARDQGILVYDVTD